MRGVTVSSTPPQSQLELPRRQRGQDFPYFTFATAAAFGLAIVGPAEELATGD